MGVYDARLSKVRGDGVVCVGVGACVWVHVYVHLCVCVCGCMCSHHHMQVHIYMGQCLALKCIAKYKFSDV